MGKKNKLYDELRTPESFDDVLIEANIEEDIEEQSLSDNFLTTAYADFDYNGVPNGDFVSSGKKVRRLKSPLSLGGIIMFFVLWAVLTIASFFVVSVIVSSPYSISEVGFDILIKFGIIDLYNSFAVWFNTLICAV